MKQENIDRIIEKYGYAKFTISSGWSKKHLMSGFGSSLPQMGKRVEVYTQGKTVYLYDDLGNDIQENNLSGIKIFGSSLYYELINNYGKYLERKEDSLYQVAFFNGIVTV